MLHIETILVYISTRQTIGPENEKFLTIETLNCSAQIFEQHSPTISVCSVNSVNFHKLSQMNSSTVENSGSFCAKLVISIDFN